MKNEELIKFLESQMEKSKRPLEAGYFSVAIERLQGEKNVMPEQKNELNPISMSELMSEQFPPDEWLIDKLVPAGEITFISAYPGNFKTWLMLDIAVRLSQGEDFLKKFKTKKSKVLIIDEESWKKTLKSRIQKLTQKTNLDIKILSFSGFDISKTDQLIEYCKENKIDVVMIDSLIRIHKSKDENSSAAMSQIFSEIKKFKFNNISLLMLHHNRKTGASGGSDSAENMRGSSEIFAAADCALSLNRKKKGEIIITQTKLKMDEESNPFIVKVVRDESSTNFEFTGYIEEQNNLKKSEIAEEKILNLLEEKGGVLSKQEIINTLDEERCSAHSTKKALDYLVASGKITYVKGRGNSHLYSTKPHSQ